MESKIKRQSSLSRRRKWGQPIFMEILKKGVTQKEDLEELEDPKTGKKITGKVLWETINHLIEEDIIEKVPSKTRKPTYDLTPKYRTKEFDQIIYLNSMGEMENFSDTINFQHTIYGLPKFEDMSESQQRTALYYVRTIDDALMSLKKLTKAPMENIALLSTSPVNQTKVVRGNIELKLNAIFEETPAFFKKYKNRLSLGKLVSLERAILAGRSCHAGLWIKKELSRMKFLHHKELREVFSEDEIKFMLTLIKELVCENPDVDSSEMDQFIIYKGFSEGGLWYDENKKFFYAIANKIVESIDSEYFSSLRGIERTKKIRELILKNPDTTPNLKNETIGEFGLNELILYIDAKAYFEKIRAFEKENLTKIFELF
jgi:hypothetical protein